MRTKTDVPHDITVCGISGDVQQRSIPSCPRMVLFFHILSQLNALLLRACPFVVLGGVRSCSTLDLIAIV